MKAAGGSSLPEPGADSSQHGTSKKGKLGGLKGTKKAMSGVYGAADGRSPRAEGSGRGGKPEAVEEVKVETPDERAARRRAELERELERKAAAGPAKKKRKF